MHSESESPPPTKRLFNMSADTTAMCLEVLRFQLFGVRRRLHSQDTVEELGGLGIKAADDFDWLVQLRYYVEDGGGMPQLPTSRGSGAWC